MRRMMNGSDLAQNGWSSVRVRHNSYAEKYFSEMDLESVEEFVNDQLDGYQLIRLPDGDDYDYALEECIDLKEYHNND